MRSLKQKIDEFQQEDDDYNRLMCSAHNCPMEWTVNMGTPLCSFHAWADKHDWPAITDKLITKAALGTMPTFQKVAQKYEQGGGSTGMVTLEEKQAILLELKKVVQGFGRQDPKAWAYALKAREEAGEQLSPLKRKMWRDALRVRDDA